MALVPFFLASLIGRGTFFLVAALMAWEVKEWKPSLKQYIERIGWATVVLMIGVILVAKF